MTSYHQPTVWFEELHRGDVATVGGKNASLGEMIQALSSKGIDVPPGFATTAQAYRQYLKANGLEQAIAILLTDWNQGKLGLAETGTAIRKLLLQGDWPRTSRMRSSHTIAPCPIEPEQMTSPSR
jgi:Phosphoenolpyruvate synthase/pyruvate phosphate dikinase